MDMALDNGGGIRLAMKGFVMAPNHKGGNQLNPSYVLLTGVREDCRKATLMDTS